ncbi:MAG: methyltransferase domain-containing protein [Terracidiphilus sp.]
MRYDAPDFGFRAQLAELMDEPCSREELRACLRDLARVNRWTMGYRPLLAWLDAFVFPMRTPIRILDAGCGYGDGLRRVARWARARGLAVELTGLDINPDTVTIAAEADEHAGEIEWICADVFRYAPRKPIHLVVSSLFTHHLDEAGVVRFLKWMEQHATLGWFVNDLSRSAVPYHLFRVFSKLARLHRFVQHDGPVSIARSFLPDDWRRMCAAAGLSEEDVRIRGYRPARLCAARSKMR